MFLYQLSISLFFFMYVFIFYFLNEIISVIYLNTFFSESFIFFFVFIFFFLTNYIFWEEKTDLGMESELENVNDLNLDIFYKFLLLFNKNINTLINYLIVEVKKLFVFLFKFKFFFKINNIKKFYKLKINKKLILWRPIFKKWSYFGYYRSNRSKWIK